MNAKQAMNGLPYIHYPKTLEIECGLNMYEPNIYSRGNDKSASKEVSESLPVTLVFLKYTSKQQKVPTLRRDTRNASKANSE